MTSIEKTKLNSEIAGWDNSEIIELLSECEIILSYNAGQINQLEVKGLKRWWKVITGVFGKTEQDIRQNAQRIQQVTLEVQKEFLKKIDLLDDMMDQLDKKVDYHVYRIQRIIYKMLDKVDNITIENRLTQWVQGIQYREIEGREYSEVAEGMKILLVASDLFRIVHNRIDLIDSAQLKNALHDGLELPKEISSTDFCQDIVKERGCLPLYVKDNYDYQMRTISRYGRMIYKVAECYGNSLLGEVSEIINKPLESLCWQITQKGIQGWENKISCYDLCITLLEDLIKLDGAYQEKIGVEEQADNSRISMKGLEDKDKAKLRYSIFRMTPEEVRLIKNGKIYEKELPCKRNEKSEYIFTEEEGLRRNLEESNPYLVTAPLGYQGKYAMPEIRTYIASMSKYISLSDYYMYLWFSNKEEKERSNKKLVFIEYYKDELPVTAYFVNDSGTGYKKQFLLWMSHKWSITGMIKEIMGCECLKGVLREEILMFQTFKSDVQNLNKLGKEQGVELVESKWEDILREDNDALGERIQDLIERTYEAISIKTEEKKVYSSR